MHCEHTYIHRSLYGACGCIVYSWCLYSRSTVSVNGSSGSKSYSKLRKCSLTFWGDRCLQLLLFLSSSPTLPLSPPLSLCHTLSPHVSPFRISPSLPSLHLIISVPLTSPSLSPPLVVSSADRDTSGVWGKGQMVFM